MLAGDHKNNSAGKMVLRHRLKVGHCESPGLGRKSVGKRGRIRHGDRTIAVLICAWRKSGHVAPPGGRPLVLASNNRGRWAIHKVWNLLLALAVLPSPALAQTDTIRFAAFGDFGKGTGTTAVAQLVNDQAPDFIVALGDNCYGATPPIATQVGTPYGNWVADSRFWPALGNHEFSDACGGGSAASGYRDYFALPNNERYYDTVIGPVHLFALNSEIEPDGTSATSKQAKWLKAKLAASTSPWQVVFFHRPPYSSGGGTKTGMRWPFEKWGVDAVLTAHAHDYERILKDDDANGVTLPYFVSGLGGKSIGSFSGNEPGSAMRYNAEYGSMFITASSTTIDFEFRNTSGAIIDTYSIQKSTTQPTKFEWKTVP